ncbi:MAG: archaemetzincin family Zn-dependent metalloprotease [Acidobacteriota bacterium]
MSLIYLTRVGTVEEGVLDFLQRGLAGAFGLRVECLEPLPDPSYAFDPKRRQYSSVALMHELMKVCPGPDVRVLGVTERDLFIPVLSFVFGQAQLNGPLSVVSLARLHQEFYQFAPDTRLLEERALKESMHELGHTFGLVHCPEKSCPMSLATNIRQLDLKRTEWCVSCEILLQEAIVE